jgi:uncharacterized surface protein with fasciclin (FAS1) repeats
MNPTVPPKSGRWIAAAALALSFAATPVAASASASSFAQCARTQAVDFPGTIVDAAVATPALSTLTSLVVAANLVGPLSAAGNLTVFAPTNDAFSKVPPSVLGAIGGDPATLTAVLTYHVVAGKADPRKPFLRKTTSLQGQSLFVGYDRGSGAPMINQSMADCTAVRTSNGTVWIIDSVLLPQFR